MLKKPKILLLINKVYKVLLLFTLCFHIQGAMAQGLLFKSNDSLLTKRTSMHVFGADAPVFHDHFTISFDLSLWDNSNLGYVFNVADGTNSYSLSYIYTFNKGYLNFNIDSKSNKIKIPLEASILKKQKWIKVKIVFNLKGDNVIIYIDNMAYPATGFGFKDQLQANITFGKNQFYTEVPNMAVKNLEITDGNKDYLFPLNEWKGGLAHDVTGDVTGMVDNPVWLINESYFWKPVYTQQFQTVAGLNFNTNEQNLFIFTKDSLITYDPELKRVTELPYLNKLPVQMVLGKSIYNSRLNKTYLYELFDIHKGQPSVAALNMDRNNLRWETIGKDTLPSQLHHHNIFYDLNQQSFYLFGGYGGYNYHNNFLKYNDTLDKWQKIPFTGDNINPRFFSASGKADKDGEVFIFGGYGNESGSQVVGGKQYYDLYRININSHTIKKCWSIHPDKDVFVPANNLILSADKQYFYALCYPHEIAKTELRLYRFSIRDGSYDVVSAPIPVTSMRIESDINLFFSPKTNDFLCTVQEFQDRQKSLIKVYSLIAPPVSQSAYLKSIEPQKQSKAKLIYIIIFSCLVIAGLIYVLKKRKAEQVEEEPELSPEPVVEPGHLQNTKNAIYLLGEFVVFDKNGRDITYLFSPKIKQLFILILLNSFDGKGIVSKKISTLLWPDKDISKSKNIKGVTFNHLRNIIGDINGIELIFLNDTYSFKLGEDFFCDYCFLHELISVNNAANEQVIKDNFNLLLRGPLLNDMPDAWLDDFKYAYEEHLMNIILPELKKQYELRDLKLALEITKLIFSMDPFNDDALKFQLKSFRRLKGIEHAHKIYELFALEYKRSLGTDYPIAFDKIVQ